MPEFVPLGDEGRRYSEDYLIRLGDADENGLLRLDGVARLLQDVATDDWTDTGIATEDTWVVRRTQLRLVEGATLAALPRSGDLDDLVRGMGRRVGREAHQRRHRGRGLSRSGRAVGADQPQGQSGAGTRRLL